jgi:hypothetical protein
VREELALQLTTVMEKLSKEESERQVLEANVGLGVLFLSCVCICVCVCVCVFVSLCGDLCVLSRRNSLCCAYSVASCVYAILLCITFLQTNSCLCVLACFRLCLVLCVCPVFIYACFRLCTFASASLVVVPASLVSVCVFVCVQLSLSISLSLSLSACLTLV